MRAEPLPDDAGRGEEVGDAGREPYVGREAPAPNAGLLLPYAGLLNAGRRDDEAPALCGARAPYDDVELCDEAPRDDEPALAPPRPRYGVNGSRGTYASARAGGNSGVLESGNFVRIKRSMP